MAITYVDALTVAIDALDGEVAEKLTALRAQIAKKRSASSKPTKNQIANEVIKQKILEVLGSVDSPLRASEIQKELDDEYSLPKISALLTQLVNAKAVVRTVEKKVSYFGLA